LRVYKKEWFHHRWVLLCVSVDNPSLLLPPTAHSKKKSKKAFPPRFIYYSISGLNHRVASATRAIRQANDPDLHNRYAKEEPAPLSQSHVNPLGTPLAGNMRQLAHVAESRHGDGKMKKYWRIALPDDSFDDLDAIGAIPLLA